MANIYTRAALVYVWLGDDNDSELHEDSRAAFKFMEKDVLNLKNFDKLVTDEKQHKDWHNMVELLKREWFSRKWVVQEIALAHDAKILCGRHQIIGQTSQTLSRFSTMRKLSDRSYRKPSCASTKSTSTRRAILDMSRHLEQRDWWRPQTICFVDERTMKEWHC